MAIEHGAESKERVVFTIEELTDHGWAHPMHHQSRENAFWQARARSDADGRTYRVISRDQHLVCLVTSQGSDCWELD